MILLNALRTGVMCGTNVSTKTISANLPSSKEPALMPNACAPFLVAILKVSFVGNTCGLSVLTFCKKAVSKGLMVLDKSSGEYKIAGQKTMQDFADGLNLSLPMVQAMFGEMEEYGGHFDWADEAVKTIGDLGVSANEAAEKLRGLTGNEDLAIRLDVSELDTTEDKIAALETTISEMQEYKGKADVDASQIEYANQIIEYCVAQEQNLSEPIVMAVNTSALDEKTADAINKIQEFKRACNDLELRQKLGVDTTEAEKQVNDLAGQVKGIDSNILASLSLLLIPTDAFVYTS